MRKWLFFFFFHEAGGRSGDGTDALLVVGGASVGGWRSFCWWLVELLFVTGGASVGEKTKPSFGGFEGPVCSEKTVIFAERFVERFFLSVNSCMIGSYLRFEKKW